MKKRMIVLCAAAAVALCQGAWAADLPAAASAVRQQLHQAQAERAQTGQEIAQERAELSRRVATMRAQLEARQRRLADIRAQLTQISQRKAELSQEVAEKQGDLKELTGTVRAQARELLAIAERSPVTAEHPERLEALRAYIGKSRFPGLDDIRRLVDLFFGEMTATGQIARREGEIVDRDGNQIKADIIRLGGFCSIYRNGQTGFLTLGQASGQLLAVGGDPDWNVLGSLDDYFDGDAKAVYMDISGGAALRQLAKRPTFGETLMAGGPLVWPILLVGLVALALIGERIVFLRRVRANTDKMMSEVAGLVGRGDMAGALNVAEAQQGRPTSNVIKAGLALVGQPQEVIESGLAEAILRETPRLERFLQVLKVLAGVAPLLGLLGTVTGMINTFNVITVHGTGDPRLMAGGISEALITTQLGLSVAIPILIAASLLSRRAQRIAGDMEEKALALAAALLKAEK